MNRFTQELLCKVSKKAGSELCFQGIEKDFKNIFDRDTESEDKAIPLNIYKYSSTNFSVFLESGQKYQPQTGNINS